MKKSLKNVPLDWPSELKAAFSTPLETNLAEDDAGYAEFILTQWASKLNRLSAHYHIDHNDVGERFAATLAVLCEELFEGFRLKQATGRRGPTIRTPWTEARLVKRIDEIMKAEGIGGLKAARKALRLYPEYTNIERRHKAKKPDESLESRYRKAKASSAVREILKRGFELPLIGGLLQ